MKASSLRKEFSKRVVRKLQVEADGGEVIHDVAQVENNRVVDRY
jgi:hypothetical protein